MNFKIPSKILILDEYFKIVKSPKTSGASFDFKTNLIVIGTRYLKQSPEHVFNILVHEISEVIHCKLNTRYEAGGTMGDYKFVMDHKEFQTHNHILTGILCQNILTV